MNLLGKCANGDLFHDIKANLCLSGFMLFEQSYAISSKVIKESTHSQELFRNG